MSYHLSDNVKHVELLWYDFSREGHANGNCLLEGQTEEAQYARNFQRGKPYSNTYNLGCTYQSNLKWINNQSLNANQGDP